MRGERGGGGNIDNFMPPSLHIDYSSLPHTFMHVRTLNEGRPTSSRKRKEIKKVLSHLFGQLDVEVLDGGGEVGVLLGVGDHGALRKNQALF